MRFTRSSTTPRLPSFEPELRVVQFIATRRGDAERGPMIWLHSTEAKARLLVDGELAWVHGPRGQQVATVVIDDSVALHTCIVRDLAGVVLSEAVRVTKPDLDSPKRSTLA